MKSRLITLFTLSLLCLTLFAFAPAAHAAQVPHAAQAKAATTCFALSCNGRDPFTTGCNNDAYAVAVVYTGNLLIEAEAYLMYSPACETKWGYDYYNNADDHNDYEWEIYTRNGPSYVNYDSDHSLMVFSIGSPAPYNLQALACDFVEIYDSGCSQYN